MRNDNLERRIAFERLISTVCSRLARADTHNMDESLTRSLEEIGLFVEADRAYLFQFKNSNSRMDNTHEWCADGVEPEIDNLQDIECEKELPWFTKEIRKGDAILIPRVQDLPDEMGHERMHLERQDIQSLMVVPMKTSERIFGFLGFDAVKTARNWAGDDRMLLQFVADTMAGALQRIHTKEALKEIEANFHMFFESMTDIMVVATPKGRILFTNQAVRDKLGYSEQELAQMQIWDWHRPEDREEAKAIFTDILNGKRDCCPLPLMAKNGRHLPAESHTWFGKWSGQDCIFGICKDVSAQQEAHQRFEGIFRSNPSPMALSSSHDLRFVDVNDAFLETTGYTREEVLGRSSVELGLIVLPEAQDTAAEILHAKGRIANYELKVQCKDGTLRDGLFSGEVIRNWGQDLFLTVMVDITEQKRSETLLRQSEDYLRTLLNTLPDPVWLKDTEGVYLGCNHKFEQFFGAPESEIVGKTDYDFMDSDAAEFFCEKDRAAMAAGKPTVNEEEITFANDGHRELLETIRTPFFAPDDGLIGVLGIARDITERKQMELQLREREQRLSLALETAQLGYWKWTAVTDRVEWFGDHHKLFGIPHEDFKGTLDHVQQCVHPDDRQMGIDNINRAVEQHIPFDNTYRVVHPDGSIHWLNSYGHVSYDENGQAQAMFGITRDISEYKFAQETAEERVAQLTALLGAMQHGVLVEDMNRRVVFVNQEFCAIFGIPEPKAMLGTDWNEAARASASLFADPEAFLKTVDVRLANGEPVLNERLEMADGRFLERTYAPVNMEGHMFGHLWLYRDKTEQISIEQTIARAKEEWENTFDSVPDMICTIDKNHRIMRANRSFAERFGQTPRDLIGRTCYQCVHKLEEPPEFCPHTKTLEDKQEHTIETSEPYLGGDVLVTTTPLTDASGNFIGSVHVARDVTERNATESRLQIMGRMLDLAPSSITVHDTEGNFLFANRKTFSMHGYDEEEFLSINLHDLDVPESEALLEHRFCEIFERGEALFEVEHYRKDGSTFPLEVLARLVEWQGIPAVLSIATDISDRKRLEQERLEMERQVQHTQKLESLGVLAGGIAHDFNNLLMSILGHADLALDELTPTSPAHANIEQIETASRRAADLCAQLLAYSGRGRFIIEAFDVSTLIGEMAHLLKTSISKKAILNLQVEKNLPKIQGDTTQIRQVIMNLVINASEAIGERSGVISVSTGACQCQEEDLQGAYFEGNQAEGLYIFIEVTDTGCGMDQETLDRLFEPFFTTKFTGRGLGMSAVLGIVNGHKGILKVSSERGKGTTFRILLPSSSDCDEDDPHEAPSSSGIRASNAHVLLVEDEDSVRTLGQKMLERIGFLVTSVSDGRQALEVYGRQGQKIDLVVLDLTMPNMDGKETLHELKRIDPDVKIVMASGYSNHEIKTRLAGQDIMGFIQKPYTLAQLKERLYPLFES